MNYLDEQISFKAVDKKIIIRLRDKVCETSKELIGSLLFRDVLRRYVKSLEMKNSPLCQIFNKATEIDESDIQVLIDTFQVLENMPLENVPKLVVNSERFIQEKHLLYDFVEKFYDFWRSFERFLICDSEGERLDKRPFRTFNSTIEELMHLIRKTYRDIEENITGRHPAVYRQVAAGAEVALIALPKPLNMPLLYRRHLEQIAVIRQILLYPPLLINPPMNKRTGRFVRIEENPLNRIDLEKGEWLCYPAKVGTLFILVYFHEKFYELGLALCNLFEIAEDDILKRRPDAVYLFGLPGQSLDDLGELPTVFYDDEENDMLIGAIPGRDEFGYFGYLKKMILTLHNIKILKMGKMPYHGAMVKIMLKGDKSANILLIGDTGAGKSESLEAFRNLAGGLIKDITIIADDMGSLDIDAQGRIIGYGTEIGAFVRLDDLQPGFAFGQLDRTIIMNPAQVNARVVLPVTSYENVVKGFPVDMVLYANNYEMVDDEHPIFDRLPNPETAMHIFREGTAMSKGTTTSTGLVHTYFVNIFGAVQYRDLHEKIAERYFKVFYDAGLFVGQLRTRLGISGWEMKGPEEAAKALLAFIQER